MNLPMLVVTFLFVGSPMVIVLLMMLSWLQAPDWSFQFVIGAVFWATWFVTLRHLEERWTRPVLSLKMRPASQRH